LVTGW